MRVKIVARLTNYTHVNATRYVDLDDEYVTNLNQEPIDSEIEELLRDELDQRPMWEWDWEIVE